MIDSMFQEGTDAALDDQIKRPKYQPATSPAFNLLGLGAAPFRGIGGGVSKTIAFGAEVLGAFGQVAGAYDVGPAATPEQRRQAEAARQKILREGVDFSNEAGDTFRQRAADILPDPKTAHTSEQVVAGLTDFATRAVGYGVTLGPLGPVALAGDVGMEEADRLKQQGVDLGTRTKAGAVAGGVAGVSVAVPLAGSTRLARAGIGLAVGESGIVGQSLAERQILRAAGYDKQADAFDPLDPVALAVGAVPGVLGFAMPVRRTVPALRNEADVRAAAQLTPAEAAREAAYERSPANLRELERAIAAEKRPQVRAELEAELRKQTAAAAGEHAVERAVQAEPDLEPAARVRQTAQALEDTRLTPDTDLAGRDAHLSAVEMAGDQMGRGEPVEVANVVRVPDFVDLYHGSPHEFSAFDSAHIGKGEGAQAFGHGLYLAENEAVARYYRDVLSRVQDSGGSVRNSAQNDVANHWVEQAGGDRAKAAKAYKEFAQEAGLDKDEPRLYTETLHAIKNERGFMYRIQVPREAIARMIDLDAPIEQAPKPVQDYYRRVDAYKDGKPLTEHMAIDKSAAAEFSAAGIPGIRYKDAVSRGADIPEGTRNVVIFPGNEHLLRVVERNGKTLESVAAAADQLRALRQPAERAPSRAEVKAEMAKQMEDSTVSSQKAPAPSGARGKSSGESSGEQAPASVARAADEVAKLDPDMLVHLEGMDAPMRVGDLLERVKEEARQDTLMGKLVEVAAECSLTA